MSDMPPPPPPPMVTSASYAPAHAVGGGPHGKARSTGLVILVSIVTFGIWTIVWSYQNGEELKQHNRDGLGGVAYLFLTVFISPVTMFLMAGETEQMYRRAGQEPPVTTITGLWFLLPLIGNIVWYVKVQGALNDHWTSVGAPPASGI